MYEKEVAGILLKVNAVTLNPKKPYKYTSGILSPIYCDNRILMSYPKEREIIIDFFIELIEKKKLEFDIIAGTATAGVPWAAWISQRLKKPMIYVRKESKDHGKENLIEGKMEKGKKVLVIEDLISTGSSSIAAVRAVRKAGGIVKECCAIFTYNMNKSKILFGEEKCRLHALSNFKVLVETASKSGYIKNDDKALVLSWSKNPEKWCKDN